MSRIGTGKTFYDYFRAKAPDDDKLADLVLDAKGKFRTLTKFAEDCGVSASAISRIINKKNSGPCSDMLIKRIADNIDPKSGVTLEMLLDAHGLEPLPKTLLDSIIGDSETRIEDNSGLKNLQASSRSIFNSFEEEAKAIIQLALLERGYSLCRCKEFENSNSELRKLGERTYDLAIRTDAISGIREWFFGIKNTGYSGAKNYIDTLIVEFSSHNMIYSYRERKISLVISDENTYRKLCIEYKDIITRITTSIVCIDRGKLKVLGEFTLAHQSADSKSILEDNYKEGVYVSSTQKTVFTRNSTSQ